MLASPISDDFAMCSSHFVTMASLWLTSSKKHVDRMMERLSGVNSPNAKQLNKIGENHEIFIKSFCFTHYSGISEIFVSLHGYQIAG